MRKICKKHRVEVTYLSLKMEWGRKGRPATKLYICPKCPAVVEEKDTIEVK